MKYLIFDAGPIISLTMNGLLPVIEKLKKEFNGEFIITPAVRREVVDKPLRIKKFKLEALQVKKLIDNGTFTPSSKIIANQKLNRESSRIMKEVNNYLKSAKTHDRIRLIQDGEASCLAFANLCDCENLIVIDERTTRILVEDPERLKELFQKKLKARIVQVSEEQPKMNHHKFIRSAELIYMAYKKGLLQEKTRNFLDAVLFALKFKGTAISSKEIEDIKKLA